LAFRARFVGEASTAWPFFAAIPDHLVCAVLQVARMIVVPLEIRQ
jgi:hypothetical protein